MADDGGMMMRCGNLLPVVFVAVLLGRTGVLEADVFNIKVLSEHTPDLTDLRSFTASVTDNWNTNDEKARALAYWMFALGDQASSNCDWDPIEPILTLNFSRSTIFPIQAIARTGRPCSSPLPKEGWDGAAATTN